MHGSAPSKSARNQHEVYGALTWRRPTRVAARSATPGRPRTLLLPVTDNRGRQGQVNRPLGDTSCE